MVKEPVTWLTYLYRALNKLENFVIITCLSGVAILTFVSVLSRYVFHHPVTWAEEFVRFLFLWGSLFGAAAAFRYGAHTGMPILVEKLPLPVQRVINLFVVVVTTIFFVILAKYTAETVVMAKWSGQVSPPTGIPYWVVNAGMLAAMVMAVVRNVEALVRLWRTPRDPSQPVVLDGEHVGPF